MQTLAECPTNMILCLSTWYLKLHAVWPAHGVAYVAENKPEGYKSILLGTFVLVCDGGQDHLKQIKACKPDKNGEPVIITQVGLLGTCQHITQYSKVPWRKM